MVRWKPPENPRLSLDPKTSAPRSLCRAGRIPSGSHHADALFHWAINGTDVALAASLGRRLSFSLFPSSLVPGRLATQPGLPALRGPYPLPFTHLSHGPIPSRAPWTRSRSHIHLVSLPSCLHPLPSSRLFDKSAAVSQRWWFFFISVISQSVGDIKITSVSQFAISSTDQRWSAKALWLYAWFIHGLYYLCTIRGEKVEGLLINY